MKWVGRTGMSFIKVEQTFLLCHTQNIFLTSKNACPTGIGYIADRNVGAPQTTYLNLEKVLRSIASLTASPTISGL